MYCTLDKVFDIATKQLKGGANGILGQGSFGQVKLMSALPKVKNFKATLTNLVVDGTGTVPRTTDLDRDGYTKFIQDNEQALVAKYFNNESDFLEEANGVKLMLSKVPGQVIEDTTIMFLVSKESPGPERKVRTFRFMVEVFGKKFLLYKRMDDNIEKLNKVKHDGYRLLYKTMITLYAFLCSSLYAGCFHRDIKPANILYKMAKLNNGDFDYEVRIGDFGLFTEGTVTASSYTGTPLYMCVYDPVDLVDSCSLIDDDDNSSRVDAQSYYDIGLLANETYAYSATLVYLASYVSTNAELTKYLKSKKEGVLKYINKTTVLKPFQYNFVEMAAHPKVVIKQILDGLPKVPVSKVHNPQQPVFANSFIADLAMHEIDKYLRENKKKGILLDGAVKIYRPYGSEHGPDIYLSIESPFIYTYLLTLILDGIPRSDYYKKDLSDYSYYYDKTSFPYVNPANNPNNRVPTYKPTPDRQVYTPQYMNPQQQRLRNVAQNLPTFQPPSQRVRRRMYN